MSGVEHANPVIFLLLGILLLPVPILIKRAKRTPEKLFVRRIPGIDAILEAVGRAAEMGRPISFSTGMTAVGPVLYACLGILYSVTRRAALLKSRLLVPQNDPEVVAMVENTLRDAYRDAGRSGLFNPQSVVFLSGDQFAFASGYMGLLHRERVGSAFLFGSFAAESLILAEAGQQVGAMQIAGSISPEQVPFFVCACDYALIGEELFAASAYLTREPIQLGSLIAQDIAKLSLLTIIILGVLLTTLIQLGVALPFAPHRFATLGVTWWEGLW